MAPLAPIRKRTAFGRSGRSEAGMSVYPEVAAGGPTAAGAASGCNLVGPGKSPILKWALSAAACPAGMKSEPHDAERFS